MNLRNQIFATIVLILGLATAASFLVGYFFLEINEVELVSLSAAFLAPGLLISLTTANLITKNFKKPLNKINKRYQDHKVPVTQPRTGEFGEFTQTVMQLDSIVEDAQKYKQEADNQIKQKNNEIAEINKKLKVFEGASIQVFEELKKIDKLKTEFISLASHQLRTPLVAIKWGISSILKGELGEINEQVKDYAKDIYASNERMISLVTGLLNVSRIESGRLMITPEPTSVAALIESVVGEVTPEAKKKVQQINFSVKADLPQVNIDPELARHVVTNLLTNAIKYSPEGKTINIELSKSEESALVSVQDQGMGIPQEAQNKLFEKFFRADNVRKAVPDGTGLGLYLAKAVVESMGGTIWFESKENKGTTFWFTIPLVGVKPKEGEVTLS